MAGFTWTDKKDKVCAELAEGYTQKEVADRNGLSLRTVERYMADTEFREEFERLSSFIALAHRGARLRLAQRVLRKKLDETETLTTEKDSLDWLKYIQSETEGINLRLADTFTKAAEHLAGGGQARDSKPVSGDTAGEGEAGA